MLVIDWFLTLKNRRSRRSFRPFKRHLLVEMLEDRRLLAVDLGLDVLDSGSDGQVDDARLRLNSTALSQELVLGGFFLHETRLGTVTPSSFERY